MAHSLRVFDLAFQDERPWKEAMPGLNVLISDIDHLSQKLGCLSLTLRHLKLENVSLAPDFLFPLDETGCPLPSSAFLQWPYLEIVDLGEIPPRLPSGTFHTLRRFIYFHLPRPRCMNDIVNRYYN